MTPFCTYDPATGEIRTYGVCQPEDLEHQGGFVVEGVGQPATHCVVNGALVAYSEDQLQAKAGRPRHKSEWLNSTMAWRDVRTAGEIAEDAVQLVRAARRAAYPPIGDQLDCLWKAMRDGVLPKVEPFYGDIEAVKTAHPMP